MGKSSFSQFRQREEQHNESGHITPKRHLNRFFVYNFRDASLLFIKTRLFVSLLKSYVINKKISYDS